MFRQWSSRMHFPNVITCGASGGCNYTVRVEGQRPGGLNVQACASGLCTAAQSGTNAVTAELSGRFPLFGLDFYGVGNGDNINLNVRIHARGLVAAPGSCGSAGAGCL